MSRDYRRKAIWHIMAMLLQNRGSLQKGRKKIESKEPKKENKYKCKILKPPNSSLAKGAK